MIDRHYQDFYIRSIAPGDKEMFMNLRKVTSIFGEAYDRILGFKDSDWNYFLNNKNDHYMMVFDCDGERFIGSCSFQDIIGENTGKEKPVAIGIDIVENLRGQGIGTRILKALIEIAHDVFPERDIQIRVLRENIASRRIIEKNGGVFLREEMTPESARVQGALEESVHWTPAPSEHEIQFMRNAISEGADGVLVYRV